MEDGTTVAVAVIAVDASHFRRSVNGEPRYPLCGMGVCFECRVTIDGVGLQRSCTTPAREGMEIVTVE